MEMLEDNVYRQPGYLMWRAHQLAWRAFVGETQDAGVTPIQYAILIAAWEFPSTDATRIADLLLFEKTTINDIVQRLESKGLLVRRTSASDKRIKAIFITDAGRAIVEAVNPARTRIAEKLLATLTARERTALLQLLRKLVSIDDVLASTLLYAREMAREPIPTPT